MVVDIRTTALVVVEAYVLPKVTADKLVTNGL